MQLSQEIEAPPADERPSAPETQAAEPLQLRSALAWGSALWLAACGGGGGTTATGAGAGTGPVAPVGYTNFPAPTTDAEAARFLLQAQLSATDAEVAGARGKTYAAWLAAQFTAPPGPTGWDWLEGRGYGDPAAYTYFFNNYPADFMVWNQLFTAQDGMRKRVALALSEIFVASMVSSEFDWRSHGYAAYWDLLNKNAFGNFRTLLEDVTLNPAMGYFLNTKGNQKENAATGRAPDENYAREVMQLFTIGLYQLNLDGTEKLDANGNKIETYTQSDVSNLARMFTGYDFNIAGTRVPVVGQTYTINPKESARAPMVLTAANHSTLAATFLGVTVPANTPGAAALKTTLDTLFNHPNTAPFFCKQLIQRLVTSNPSPAYVARVSAAFVNNGAGVRGDISAVLATMLLDDEARSPTGLTDPGFGKLREPMLRFVHWGRSFGFQSAYGSWKIYDLSDPAGALGQSPLRAPSVFNYFRPGYVPPSTALSATMTPAPEFQLVNESSVGGYLNYMQNMVLRGQYVNSPEVPQSQYVAGAPTNGYDITAAYTAELALVLDATALVARLSLLLCAGQLSAATQTLIVTALNATPLTAASLPAAKLNRVAAAVLMVMASAEYLVQK